MSQRQGLLCAAGGGTVVRDSAGDLADHRGPGDTHTPIAMVHATLGPGARLDLPWRRNFNALVYVCLLYTSRCV